MQKILRKFAPIKQLPSDGNLICIIIMCSYSPEMKFQYMKNTLHVAHYHINRVLLTRNMFQQAHVPNKLGRFGAGFPIAPVLLFELYLAISHSSTSRSSSRGLYAPKIFFLILQADKLLIYDSQNMATIGEQPPWFPLE